MNILREDYEINKLVNQYNIDYLPKRRQLIINGPIKIEHFIKLRNYIILKKLNYINDIIVE